MTRKEMKTKILQKMSQDDFNKRYAQLIDWNSATQVLTTILNELENSSDSIETMHHIMYEIG